MTPRQIDSMKLAGWYALTGLLFLPTAGMSTNIAIHKTIDYCDAYDCHLLPLD